MSFGIVLLKSGTYGQLNGHWYAYHLSLLWMDKWLLYSQHLYKKNTSKLPLLRRGFNNKIFYIPIIIYYNIFFCLIETYNYAV